MTPVGEGKTFLELPLRFQLTSHGPPPCHITTLNFKEVQEHRYFSEVISTGKSSRTVIA